MTCLLARSPLALNYRNFVSGGGVLLILSGLTTDLPADQACTAPMALLSAVLGPSRTDGCACSPAVDPRAVAKLDVSDSTVVLGEAAVPLISVGGTDYSLSLGYVGGLPLTCPPSGPSGPYRYDYDICE